MHISPERGFPQRGAARVSAVWLIVLIVLLGVSSAFIYIANQEASRAKEDLAKADQEEREARGLLQAESQKAIDVSKALGWRDPDDPLSVTNLAASEDALDGLKAVFPDIDGATSFEEVVQPLITAYRTQLQNVSTLQGERDTLQAQVRAKDDANRQLESSLQDRIQTLESEKTDAEQASTDSIADLERRLADMTTKYNQVADELNEEKARYDTLEQAKERDALAARTRILTVNSQLDELRHQSEQPDAEILEVSKALNIGWINRGTIDRVSEGMVFEVRTGNPNPTVANRIKSFAEVTKAEANRSRVRFFDQADEIDPPVSGDLAFNPVYEPSGERYAVLAGRFSGAHDEAEIVRLLDEIGIRVQKLVDQTTNYLIVGGPLFQDPDTGETVEDPIQPSELPVYKDAQAFGCAIITINDLRKYFRR